VKANLVSYKIGKFLSLLLPLKVGYFIAVILSTLYYFISKEDKEIVRKNFKIVFPSKTKKEIKKITLEVFGNFGKYLVDFFRFSKLDKEYISRYVRIEGLQHLDTALENGKGVIGLSCHIGNWELAGVVMAQLGYPICVVALPHKDNRINNFFNYQRRIKGVNVIPLGKAVRSCIEALKRNEIVSILGDRDFTQGGILLEFFNQLSYIPKGPAVFSLIAGAPIVPGFIIREKNDKFKLILEEPIEFFPSGNRERDVEKLTEKCVERIENFIKKYPVQWYCFGKIWL